MELIEYEISKLRSILSQSNEGPRRISNIITLKEKNKIVWRLIYINLLGYNIDFGWFEIIELIGSTNYKDKQCGYLAASTIFREKTELLRLLINTLKQDLKNCFEYLTNSEYNSCDSRSNPSIGLELNKHASNNYFSKKKNFRRDRIAQGSCALSFIGNSPTLDIADNLFTDIKKIAELPMDSQSFDTHVIRSKAICCLLKLFQCCPDRLRANEWAEKLIAYFQYERNIDCLISLCNLMKNCLKQKNIEAENFHPLDIDNNVKNPENFLCRFEDKNSFKEVSLECELIKEWEFVVPHLIFALHRIRIQENKDWKFHNIPHFWLQIRLIEILQYFPLIKQEQIVLNRIYQIMEDVFFQGTQAIKFIQNSILNTEYNYYDYLEIQCIIGIAIEMVKYVIKMYDLVIPRSIVHLMAKFLLGLLYTENKDYISISISLIFDSKTISVVEELIRKNLVVLIRFTCSIDEDTTMNLLNIFSHVCDKYNWKFIAKEILNSVSYKYLLNSIEQTQKSNYNLKRLSDNYFFPESAKTLLEEIILTVCYMVKRFSNSNEVSLKTISLIFQLLEKFQQNELEAGIDELTDNTLFQIMDILSDNKHLENKEGKNENKDINAELKIDLNVNIHRFVTFKAYKLLNKWGKCTEKFIPHFGMRWLCFLLGEYGHLISNKISVLEQIETLLNIYDVLSSNPEDEYVSLVKSMAVLSFTRFYCNSDQNTQNQIFEMLKLGVSNRGNSLDSPEFMNAIASNTQYSNTPINKNVSPINELNDNSSALKTKLTKSELFMQKNEQSFVSIEKNKYKQGNCTKSFWLSLCLINKGDLYQSNYLTINFSNVVCKRGAGESIVNLKFRNLDKKNRVVKIEKISTLLEENKHSSKCSDSFSAAYDSLTRNLEVVIPNEILDRIARTQETFEQRISINCRGAYLNPPIISLLLRVFFNSNKKETSKDKQEFEDKNCEDKNSKLVNINFRLPVILTSFMNPTKKMERSQFEHFWERFAQVSIKGRLAISLLEIPTYLELLNFSVGNYSDNCSNSNRSEKIVYYGTSTLYLSGGKRIPCMLTISPNLSRKEDLNMDNKVIDEEEKKKFQDRPIVELKVRSSSVIVAKVVRQILVSYIIINSN